MPTTRTMLLVEDSPADVMLTREALAEAQVNGDLHVVTDGEQALDFLRRRGAYALAPVPDLVLLDLNLPRKDGREVLEEVKEDPDLRTIPIIVLSTSAMDEDVKEAYRHHVNAYVQKPVDLNALVRIVEGIESFWMSAVRLPPH